MAAKKKNPATGRTIGAAKEKQGKLTTAGRTALARSQYALPPDADTPPGQKGRYPIDTPERARSALARVEANGTPAEKKKVLAAVHRRYPQMQMAGSSRRKKG
jgi:hypothetical protein